MLCQPNNCLPAEFGSAPALSSPVRFTLPPFALAVSHGRAKASCMQPPLKSASAQPSPFHCQPRDVAALVLQLSNHHLSNLHRRNATGRPVSIHDPSIPDCGLTLKCPLSLSKGQQTAARRWGGAAAQACHRIGRQQPEGSRQQPACQQPASSHLLLQAGHVLLKLEALLGQLIRQVGGGHVSAGNGRKESAWATCRGSMACAVMAWWQGPAPGLAAFCSPCAP